MTIKYETLTLSPTIHRSEQKEVMLMDVIDDSVLYKNMYSDYPEIVGTKQICQMLNINEKRVYALIRSGKLPRLPCSRTILVAKIFVIKYVLQSAQEPDG